MPSVGGEEPALQVIEIRQNYKEARVQGSPGFFNHFRGLTLGHHVPRDLTLFNFSREVKQNYFFTTPKNASMPVLRTLCLFKI